ncbi:MAG: hypothetical protein JST84_05090 [Acidobacteria bacterium]|nr:hypothetical protein [Acidobacteriota bacterium]
MTKNNTNPKVYSFAPYVDDVAFLTRYIDRDGQKSQLLREVINLGAYLHKAKPRSSRTIVQQNRPLGEIVSVTLFETDAAYVNKLIGKFKTSDILRELLSLGIQSRRSQINMVSEETNNRLAELQESVKAMTELLLLVASRTMYGLEISTTILAQLVTDPGKLKAAYTQIQKQGTEGLGKLLAQLNEQEIPDWLTVSLSEKILKIQRKGETYVN